MKHGVLEINHLLGWFSQPETSIYVGFLASYVGWHRHIRTWCVEEDVAVARAKALPARGCGCGVQGKHQICFLSKKNGTFPKNIPICSMYGIFTNICIHLPMNHPNVGRDTVLEQMGSWNFNHVKWNLGKTRMNHPPNHHFHRWCKPVPNGWFFVRAYSKVWCQRTRGCVENVVAPRDKCMWEGSLLLEECQDIKKHLASGKPLQKSMERSSAILCIFTGKTQDCNGSFSIVMLIYHRVYWLAVWTIIYCSIQGMTILIDSYFSEGVKPATRCVFAWRKRSQEQFYCMPRREMPGSTQPESVLVWYAKLLLRQHLPSRCFPVSKMFDPPFL